MCERILWKWGPTCVLGLIEGPPAKLMSTVKREEATTTSRMDYTLSNFLVCYVDYMFWFYRPVNVNSRCL